MGSNPEAFSVLSVSSCSLFGCRRQAALSTLWHPVAPGPGGPLNSVGLLALPPAEATGPVAGLPPAEATGPVAGLEATGPVAGLVEPRKIQCGRLRLGHSGGHTDASQLA
jgi:hypothetical protein